MGKDMFVNSEWNGIDGLVQSVLEVNSEPRGYWYKEILSVVSI